MSVAKMNETSIVDPISNKTIALLRVMRTKEYTQVYCRSEEIHNLMKRSHMAGRTLSTRGEVEGTIFEYFDIRLLFNEAVFDDPYISVNGLELGDIQNSLTQDNNKLIRKGFDRNDTAIWIPQLKILTCSDLDTGCYYTYRIPVTTDAIRRFIEVAEAIIVWLYNTFCVEVSKTCVFKLEETESS